MKKAVGYARVSTTEQATEGVSMDMQEAKIRAYCELHDLELVDVIADNGLSGKSIAGRPGIQQVLTMVRKKQTDCVIVFKLDRLGRNTVETLEMAEIMRKNGVALHSISEKLDTESAVGEFFFTLMASLAQMERKLIGERTKAALDRKREKGERLGGRAPYGFQHVNGRVVTDPKEQMVIGRIKALKSMKCSVRGIQGKLTAEGLVNRKGRSFGVAEIHKIAKVVA